MMEVGGMAGEAHMDLVVLAGFNLCAQLLEHRLNLPKGDVGVERMSEEAVKNFSMLVVH